MKKYYSADEVNAMTESEYDHYFRTKVQEALDDDSPSIPHEVVMDDIKKKLSDSV